MFHIILYEPEIPPNTGNIIRLCANTGMQLHIVEPCGFELDDKRLRRAGLDYHEFTNIKTYSSFVDLIKKAKFNRLFALSSHGKKNLYDIKYEEDDAFIFGPETRGLPVDLRNSLGHEAVLRIPMQPDNRSMNLSNSVAVVVYEAWRQHQFLGST